MELQAAALRAMANAYAPYSRFRVGAALLTPSGIYAGCNVENAAYPEGTCAEAGAIAAMCAAGERVVEAVWVAAESERVITPCGGCRQKLAEFAKPDVPVILGGPGGEKARTTVGALLPGGFSAGDLP